MNVNDMTVREAAELYISKGLQVVPLQAKDKDCYFDGWKEKPFKPKHFHPEDNIGIKSMGGIVDIDLDSDEVVVVADLFLPKTGAIYGRKSKPKSHRIYRCEEIKTPTALKDLCAPGTDHKSSLIEIRVNHQSMAPPSIHPEGEKVEWEGELGEIPIVDPTILIRAVRLVATAALVLRWYPAKGNRHAWTMSLSGVMRHLGITKEEALKTFSLIILITDDDEPADRTRAVKDTYAKGEDVGIAAEKALVDEMGKGQEFVKTLRKIWGSEGKDHRGFITNKDGKVIPNNQQNVKMALEKLKIDYYYDEFSMKRMIRRQLPTGADSKTKDKKYGGWNSLEDVLLDRLWLEIDERFHFQPSFVFYTRVIMDLIRQKPKHPVKEYLKSLKWDKKPRLDKWLVEYSDATDSKYARAIGSIVLIAAVRRVRQPGCKFDEMIILESDQGKNKSTMLTTLIPKLGWISDDLPLGAGAKEVIERTAGIWIVEAAELHGRQRDAERLKSFLSRRVDGPVRQAYGRLSIEVPRQFIIVGTVNPNQYLKDSTGNRRYWPIDVGLFDLKKVKENRDQLWAEAAFREAERESIRLPVELWGEAAVEQEARRGEDPWEGLISEHYTEDRDWRVTASDPWEVLDIPPDRRTEQGQARINRIMLQFGFRKMTVRTKSRTSKRIVSKGWGRNVRGPQGSLPLSRKRDADGGSEE